MQTKHNHGSPGRNLSHPTPEEWMSCLYGELAQREKSRLTQHLESCADCQREMEQWKAGMTALDEFKLPARRVPLPAIQRALKWGFAAALLLVCGFAAGRLASPASADMAALRTTMTKQGQQLDEFRKAMEQRRSDDNQLIYAALAKLDASRINDFVALRKDLETMAVLTQSSFQQANDQLASLATFSPPQAKELNQ